MNRMTNSNEQRIKEITYNLYRLQEINRLLAEEPQCEYEHEILIAEKEMLEKSRSNDKQELQQLLEQTNDLQVVREVLNEIF